jgi:arsenite-transporting ATPase
MRIVLYTGKGGVGKTCVSAAAALAAAKRGHRTVILSSDRAHSLGDCFEQRLGPEPREVVPNLEAFEVDSNVEVAEHWGEIRDYARALVRSQGVDGLLAEEIAMIPGFEEASVLLRLKHLWDAGDHDALIVDCAPTGATLRLLSFPEAFGWFMRRIFPIHRAAMRVLRPTAGHLISIPLPGEEYYDAIKRLYERLIEISDLLTDPVRTGVRLVTIPERMAVEETRRAYAEFSLYGLCVEQVIANRILPDEVTDPYLDELKASQREWLKQIREDFHPTEVTEARLLSKELVGVEALEEFGEALYGDRDPMAQMRSRPPVRIEESDGSVRMLVELGFAAREDVELMQHGDELVVAIGGSRRNLLLPGALARMTAAKAKVTDGVLEVEFVRAESHGGPDPASAGCGLSNDDGERQRSGLEPLPRRQR